jgi:hypothetical protein
MKKLVLLTCVAFCIVCIAESYKKVGISQKNAINTTTRDSVIVEESLNGILQPIANTMVQNAVSTIDNSPANTQIWFSLHTLRRVDSLLRSDSAGVVKPDGIRIYFSSTAPTTANPLHYNNGIVVVSTYKSGVVLNGDFPIVVHTDYFEHLASDSLFKLSPDSIGGIATHDNDTTNGSMLYYSCNCKTISCLTSSDHYITRSEGEQLVQAFYSKPKPFSARSEWFDIGMLNALIAEMQKNHDDGIRIYFARGVAKISNPDDEGKARFVIVTTRLFTDPATNKSIHKDYFGCDQAAAILASKLVEKRKGGSDNGELCPTNCYGVTQP